MDKAEFRLLRQGKRIKWGTETSTASTEASYYSGKFENGVGMYPRPFFFVEPDPVPVGFDARRPPFRTSPLSYKGGAQRYKDVVIRGGVERQFLFTTILNENLVSFATTGFRTVVLPVAARQNRWDALSEQEVKRHGELARWVEQVREGYTQRNSGKRPPDVVFEDQSARQKLTKQRTDRRFAVIYCAWGDPVAAVVPYEAFSIEIGRHTVPTAGLVIENCQYVFQTDSEDEAHYLAAVVNSPLLLSAVTKWMTERGFGEAHIHTRIFDQPIPRFDEDNERHRSLAEAAKTAAEKVRDFLASTTHGKAIGSFRLKVRKHLRDELAEIDRLVSDFMT
ncbi:MAG: hypothetical protein WBC44_17475 [Planctomycetaceae bacterium]